MSNLTIKFPIQLYMALLVATLITLGMTLTGLQHSWLFAGCLVLIIAIPTTVDVVDSDGKILNDYRGKIVWTRKVPKDGIPRCESCGDKLSKKDIEEKETRCGHCDIEEDAVADDIVQEEMLDE